MPSQERRGQIRERGGHRKDSTSAIGETRDGLAGDASPASELPAEAAVEGTLAVGFGDQAVDAGQALLDGAVGPLVEAELFARVEDALAGLPPRSDLLPSALPGSGSGPSADSSAGSTWWAIR